MKITQNRQTLNSILRYIKMNSKNGMLKESMMTIAQNTGYSNATIHRSLNQLQLEGLIQVIKTKSQRKPNTICYIGPEHNEVTDLLEKAHVAVHNLHQASNEVKDIMSELQHTITLMETGGQDYIELH